MSTDTVNSESLLELRDYQVDAVQRIHAEWVYTRAVILEMFTGAGKTITASALSRDIFAARPNAIVGWMVHTGHLREQAAEAFDLAGVPWVDWSTVPSHRRCWEPGQVHCFGATMKPTMRTTPIAMTTYADLHQGDSSIQGDSSMPSD